MRIASVVMMLALSGCSPSDGPQSGSQTNWLLVCESSDECGGLECECGRCTLACDSDAECGGLPDASCVVASDEGAIALCGGRAPPQGLCLPRCSMDCAEGTSCVAGVCMPVGTSTARLTVETNTRYQTLVGFGASLSYAENPIVDHPEKAALYDLLFSDTGLDLLRMGNRYQSPEDAVVEPASEIVAAASERIGRRPVLLMTSASPPAPLKASGSRWCSGDLETCTLAPLPEGGFDYAAFGRYWRDSLEAYADADVLPDYISIQNNPDWVPPEDNPNEACHFLPEEGTSTATVDGKRIEIAYPGYREALSAVRTAIADLPVVPRLIAPEAARLGPFDEYVAVVDPSSVDALALHLYGEEATVDVAALEGIHEVATRLDRPVFQTEMQANGIQTAVLLHYALSTGVSAYLQNDIVFLSRDGAEVGLVLVTDEGFEPQGPYYALTHYARHTDPGWVRVDASSDSTDLLGSAWLSPDETSLVVVVVNPSSEDLEAEIVLEDSVRARLVQSEVMRTAFDGIERAVLLGQLSAAGIVGVPSHSIVTIALRED